MTINESVSFTERLIDRTLLSKTGSLLGMAEYLSQSKGKGIRAKLLLSAAMRPDGTVHDDAPKAAAAVELLHMATLVHDDVIDNAPIRRGVPSLHAKFGNRNAIICGDYLLCLALELVSDIVYSDYSKHAYLIPSMTKTLRRVCEGECRQIIENKNVDLSFANYLRIISGKTGALFYLSAYTGAIIGGSDEKETKSLAGFGKNLGMMFQIADDFKDYEQSEEQAKKPVKNDISQGDVTLPLIFALRKNQTLRQFAIDVFLNNHDPARLVKEVIGTGAVEDAKNIAARYRLKAERYINDIKDENKKNLLAEILKRV